MAETEPDQLRMVQLFSWVVLGILLGLAGVFFGPLMVRAVLVGGLLANLSFWLLKRDLSRLLQGELVAVKPRFFIKYYARLVLITVILFLVIRYNVVHVIGLLAGLSTVFVSIAVVAIDSARKEINSKEAS
jgi:hypothetical protein